MVIVAASPATAEARELMRELDAEIAALYPESPIDGINVAEFEKTGGYFVVAQDADHAIACGGFKPVDADCAEIKRMFVRSGARRRGIAREILRHLEAEVRRRGFPFIVLETGRDNSGAIALYESEGYTRTPSFPGCVGIAISRCYRKRA
jgi:GNAT superfamily N-acetyltransferase